MHRSLISLTTLVIVAALASGTSDACKVTSKTYSAQDGLVLTSVAHTISFTADCPPNVIPVYANLNGRTLAVVRNDNEKSFSISWINELAKASSGSYNLEVFDEEGYQLFKKSRSSGKELFSLPFSHSSPYKGPLFQFELVALVTGLLATYIAIVYRFKITSKKI
ncbi:PREDICTED: translocon-associated protein subunit delta-like [Rhagoletis zephyria]|uniref:translocon-associated protein subunit delta-like n=1 Tax=Rhagoletis zephyria TaxID=28612 RepID=UPI0008112897|nr:PREDICTED: translocon-associated protein subunit delta-like [Rhagoletis zephyria]KAH9400132.1 SWI/SNF and RSC complex subunit Ssr4 [Tyrophagus putrescentiae]